MLLINPLFNLLHCVQLVEANLLNLVLHFGLQFSDNKVA